MATLPSVLLVQVRDHAGAERHELECVAERLSRPVDSIDTWSVVKRPDLRAEVGRGYDVVVLGGAGAHSATADDPFVAPLIDFVRSVVDDGRPFFGSCYGHQLLGRALGGRVVTDPERGEIGTFDVTLTEAGVSDPLFAGVPRTFAAQLGHHDRVDVVPPGCSVLATSERCSVQVLRVDGLPVIGTQFHGEMDEHAMRQRVDVYGDAYLDSEEERRRFLESLRPGPHVAGLMKRFVELYA